MLDVCIARMLKRLITCRGAQNQWSSPSIGWSVGFPMNRNVNQLVFPNNLSSTNHHYPSFLGSMHNLIG